jgi:hypothetical protein
MNVNTVILVLAAYFLGRSIAKREDAKDLEALKKDMSQNP